MKHSHVTCKPGAAVRLHGYMPARVESLEMCKDWTLPVAMANCVITARREYGPHGYKPGERVTVYAYQAVPRDLVRTARGSGRLYWSGFDIVGVTGVTP